MRFKEREDSNKYSKIKEKFEKAIEQRNILATYLFENKVAKQKEISEMIGIEDRQLRNILSKGRKAVGIM